MDEKYTCVIVDDEPLARRLLSNYVEKTPQLRLEGVFRSALDAIEFLKSNQVDLLFSDINMPGISGIGLVESVPNLPPVIFTTAYEEYAVKAFELDVLDYLVKPFPLERFQKAVNRFEEYYSLKSSPDDKSRHLMVKSNRGFVRISHDQILYIEAMGEYMKFVLDESSPELVYIRMKELDALLGESFIRIHKSYLVNLKKITKLSGNDIIVGGTSLKVSRNYKAEVLRKISL